MTTRAVCLTVMLLGGVAFAESSQEQQVHKAVEDNYNAIMHKDAPALEKQYADDYQRVGVTGKVTNKTETIKLLTSQPLPQVVPPFDQVQPDLKIRTYGNVAVVTGLSEIMGKTRKHSERIVQVWVKRDGAWQMELQQRTSTIPLPEAAWQSAM